MKIAAAVKARIRYLWAAFRLTIQDWDKILEYQDGRCFICRKLPRETRFHTDHDHKTGLVRGLLCSQCNRALGKAEDPRWQWTAECFARAAIYLTTPPATQALGRQVFGYPGKIGTKKFRKWVAQNA